MKPHSVGQWAEFVKAWEQTRELEKRILEMPGTREVYMHLRWHSQHPGEKCSICSASN